MPQIFEIFGYPISLHTPEIEQSRRQARCPFMGGECDGGGNRYSSQIELKHHAELREYFGECEVVASGICSIRLLENDSPWVVCPRRLLVLGRENAVERNHQQNSEVAMLKLLGYKKGTNLGIWSEVKLEYKEVMNGVEKTFDYTFDYLVMPIGSVGQDSICEQLHGKWSLLRRILEKSGYTIARRDGMDYVENFPIGVPSIIEIMTSSTSGGNKRKRTTIAQSFEDAIFQKPHAAPSINKRQVWARMASQLIVKSEAALSWGGKTLWLIQDTLADYISASTALDLNKFVASHTDEVNILSFAYAKESSPNGIVELKTDNLFAGKISSGGIEPSFQDIVKSPVCPPLSSLLSLLVSKGKPVNVAIAP